MNKNVIILIGGAVIAYLLLKKNKNSNASVVETDSVSDKEVFDLDIPKYFKACSIIKGQPNINNSSNEYRFHNGKYQHKVIMYNIAMGGNNYVWVTISKEEYIKAYEEHLKCKKHNKNLSDIFSPKNYK